MKRASITALLSVLVLVQVLIFPAAAFADQWVPAFAPNSIYNFTFSDNAFVQHVSVLAANIGPIDSNGVPTQTAIQMCSSITSSGPCDLGASGTAGSAFTLLPECTTATEVDCIASMSIGTSTSTLVASTPEGMTLGQTTPGDPALGVPDGSTIGLWTNPLVNNGGTNTYSTSVGVEMYFENGTMWNISLNASINPYKVVSNPADITPTTSDYSYNGTPVVQFPWGPGNCAWEQVGECGQNEDFPTGTVATMTVRVPSAVGGWFMGRLSSPSITESKFNSTTSLITVTAGVVTTPTYAVGLTAAQTSSQVLDYMNQMGLPITGVSFLVIASNPQSFATLAALRDTANNTASGQLTLWNYATMPPGVNGQPGNSCFSIDNEVDGVVSTNAMVYQGSAPTYSNGALTYQVAGMHYSDDGSVAQGTYDLNIRDSVARCLYNFSNAPISASVLVTEDSSGDQNVATKSVSDSNGWLHVGAYGFNFSNPTISVKLTQTKPKVTPKSRKTTIVCVKGKVTKKITAKNPACPSGYRKS